jgi:hypothetical protein
MDPGPFPLHCYYCFTFTRFIYILANYYLLPLDTLNPLFTANGEIDNLIVSWDKVFGCVVCRFHIAAGENLHADKFLAPLSGVSQSWRASTFGSVILSPTGSINLGFTTEGNLLLCSS